MFKFGRGFVDDIPEISFELTTVNVAVGERRLNARWTPELAQDIQAFHNIDAEAELTALLSEQWLQEIGQEILRDLRAQYTSKKTSFKFGR